MSFMTFIKDPQQIKRIIFTALFTVGSAITAYSVFAFKGDKFGIYYRDDDQFWLAIGVAMMVLSWAIKNWKST
ncbi:MAG: hypothetical protein ACN4GM_15605 [Gammaproteobacteria bacterium]